MKDDLVGRIVGYTVPHAPIVREDEDPVPGSDRLTRWGRILAQGPFTAIIEPAHGSIVPRDLIKLADIHTTMPETY